jgi:tetratricopeptide (TPR) repeat protein
MFTKYYVNQLSVLYAAKKWDKLHRVADRLCRNKKASVVAEALRYKGLALYKQRNFSQAVDVLQRLVTIESYKTDWYNLAMAMAKNNQGDEADKIFQKIYASPTLQGYFHQISVPMMLYIFAGVLSEKGFYEHALGRITELKHMYIAANTADVSKLNAMGLPPVNGFYALALNVLRQLNRAEPQLWFAELKRFNLQV